MRGNIKSFEKPFTHAEVVALAERTLKRFGGDRNKAGRYARSMENRYESSKWAQVVEVLATSRTHHATKKPSTQKSPAQLQREIDEALAPKKVAGFVRSAGRKPGYQIVSVPILKGPGGIGPSNLDSPRERNESVVFASRGEAETYLPSVRRFAADFGRDALIKEVW